MDDNEIDLTHEQMTIDGGIHFFQHLSWKSLLDIFRKDRATESEEPSDSEVRTEYQDYE